MAISSQASAPSKIAPELRAALPVSLLLQALLLLFATFVLDGGWLLMMTLIAEIIFWLWFWFLVFLRGEKPTQLDILAVKWGYPALWLAAFYGAQLVGRLRGV